MTSMTRTTGDHKMMPISYQIMPDGDQNMADGDQNMPDGHEDTRQVLQPDSVVVIEAGVSESPAIDSTSPDGAIDSTSPDAAIDSTSPDAAIDSTSPDAAIDSTSPDGAIDSTSPDGAIDSTSPDAQWPEIQAMFVDDPLSSVELAAGLVVDSARALARSIKERQDALLAVRHGDGAGTEELRLALQQYRALWNRLEDFSRAPAQRLPADAAPSTWKADMPG